MGRDLFTYLTRLQDVYHLAIGGEMAGTGAKKLGYYSNSLYNLPPLRVHRFANVA